MFQKSTLKNGLRLITAPMPQVKSVTALVMVEAGSRYETAKINGISHFLEHMTFKGTKSRPNSLAITSLIDSIGGAMNAFTSKEYTGFFIKADASHTELLLDVISDMLQNSLFDPKEMDKERGVIIEEINMYEDQPQARVGELFEELLYGKEPLGWRIIGSKNNINSITRDDMVDYVNKMYHAKSLVVGLAGNIENGTDLVNKYFGSLAEGTENEFKPVEPAGGRPGSLIHYKKTDQAHLCLGVPAFPINHPDRYVLSVLGNILGGNMSSRLFIEVREKRGLAYYVHSSPEEFHDVGYFMTQSGLKLDSVTDAIKVIIEQYNLLTAKKVSHEELQRAKDNAKGKMILAWEDSFKVASFYTSQELMEKKVETPEEVLEKINAVTEEDILRVAKQIFVSKNLNLALIGPFKDTEKYQKILNS